jgi:hypothetical protein
MRDQTCELSLHSRRAVDEVEVLTRDCAGSIRAKAKNPRRLGAKQRHRGV